MECRTDRKISLVRCRLEETMMKYAREDIAVAFSGGVDSSLLLKTACEAAKKMGTKVYAVTFSTRLHPSCDLEIARKVAEELEVIHNVIVVDELSQAEIQNNPRNRCYLCKRSLFEKLKEFADRHSIHTILEGTNEDDLHVYRPGIQALKELGIISPLALLGITKAQVKELAAEYGISVASRPSTPCMATRLPYGENLDYELLDRIAEGEQWLRETIGGNIRLRVHGQIVRMELDTERFMHAIEMRREITEHLKALGFLYITLDLEGFRSGSMDQQD